MASALVSEHCLSPVRVIVLMILVIHNMKPMHKWLSPSWLISEPIPTRCIPMLGNLPSHREEDWELMDFELVVLQKLQWDLSSTTANDFLDQLLYRIPAKNLLYKTHSFQIFVYFNAVCLFWTRTVCFFLNNCCVFKIKQGILKKMKKRWTKTMRIIMRIS